MTITETTEFNSFLEGCQKIVDDANLSDSPKLVVRGGKQWIAIDIKGCQTMIYCFIAVQDGNSKSMGHYKRGDIMKPASYKKPTKHARGNIFDPDNGLCWITWAGPAYLKG